ncbi:MAG TPA: DUF3592 domain-containing protein [Ktedonobacteraceae bacterium]|nr:DUF3592 domain-containing protein [Ktedonobacteraceae bacterium]
MQSSPYSYPANPIGQTKRVSAGCLFTILFLLLVSLLTGLIQLHTYSTYQTYQQGSCVVNYGTTTYHSTKNSHYYTADFQYTVQTNNGQQVDASGYDAPYHTEFNSQYDAQQVVDSYNVGEVYACWYNPANPSHAVLVYRGYTINNLLTDFFLTSGGFFLGFGFLWWIFQYGFYRQVCLMTRGVLAQGQVSEHFTRRSKNGTRHYSRILFYSFDNPIQPYKVEASGTYPIGSPQPVCYDPKNPKNAKFGDRPRGGTATISLLGVIVGILIVVFILQGIWNGV